MPKTKLDTQLVELAGRNWLASELLGSGIEVARPERDRGIDLIAYVDRDARVGNFVACPIQMKAATNAVFSLDPKVRQVSGARACLRLERREPVTHQVLCAHISRSAEGWPKNGMDENRLLAYGRKHGKARVFDNETLRASAGPAVSVRDELGKMVGEDQRIEARTT